MTNESARQYFKTLSRTMPEITISLLKQVIFSCIVTFGRRSGNTKKTLISFTLTLLMSAAAEAAGPLASGVCDFDGDGYSDQAFGVPGDNIAGVPDAGSVNVIYGAPAGLTATGDQWWHQNRNHIQERSEAGDLFGSALACSDFDADGFDDLAIAAPGETIGWLTDAGLVHILYGSVAGLTATRNQIWHQESEGVEGRAYSRERFGSTLDTGDFNGDGFDDLVVGVPAERVGGQRLKGAVNVLYGSETGLSEFRDQIWHQDLLDGVVDDGKRRDLFGRALASGDFNSDGFSDLAIGIPAEPIDSLLEAGAVSVVYGGSSGLSTLRSQFWHQNQAGVKGVAKPYDRLGSALAAGDFDGDGFDDLAIGTPGETVWTASNAGTVNVLYGGDSGLSANGNQIWHQNKPGVEGDHGAFNRFGSTLLSGDFDGDGRHDLAVGAPWASLAGIPEVGVVNVFYGTSSGLSQIRNDYWHQDVAGIFGRAAPFDRLGSSLAVGDFDGDSRDDLVIGVPGERLGGVLDAGASHVLYGSPSGLTSAADQFWNQNRNGINGAANAFDRFSGRLRSDGMYRIPYANDTNVRVSRDSLTHSPQQYRIDMFGVGGEDYTIVAAASGTIEVIVDSNSEPTDDNNYVWISHPNGEWTKYSHFVTNSVTDLGHREGDLVAAGTPLGKEGDVGRASGKHLHFEVATPWDPAEPVSDGGFIRGENRDPVICNIPGESFLSAETYVARSCP